jgi:hypothetical protein
MFLIESDGKLEGEAIHPLFFLTVHSLVISGFLRVLPFLDPCTDPVLGSPALRLDQFVPMQKISIALAVPILKRTSPNSIGWLFQLTPL